MSLIEFIRLKTEQFVLQSVALCPGPVVWASVRDFSLLKRGVESHALLLGEAWAKHWKAGVVDVHSVACRRRAS